MLCVCDKCLLSVYQLNVYVQASVEPELYFVSCHVSYMKQNV